MNDIATPGLNVVGDLLVNVAPPLDIGQTPNGMRRIVPLLGGTFRGPRLNGQMIPGGADFQIWRSDKCTEIHARYVLETETGARIYVENTGLRHGPPEAMERLSRGEAVDPALIYFRSVARFEASAPELAWLMRGIFLCSGARYPDRVAIRFFEVT
ncbi:MAG: DUF3237 domain-containing protein [Xanthobacteraceae bacterium]